MTTTLDPGKTTPTKPPYLGDKAAEEIRAILKRLRGGKGGSVTTVETSEEAER